LSLKVKEVSVCLEMKLSLRKAELEMKRPSFLMLIEPLDPAVLEKRLLCFKKESWV
jgi:hypothetical protein